MQLQGFPLWATQKYGKNVQIKHEREAEKKATESRQRHILVIRQRHTVINTHNRRMFSLAGKTVLDVFIPFL